MIEVLTELEGGKCIHCGLPIRKYRGEWSGEFWTHFPGRRECPETKYAEPGGE